MKKIFGLTLIEMMLSLTLSALLLSILSSYLSYAYLQYKLQNQINFELLQAQTISEMFLQSIHQAGYIGCVDRHLTKNTNFLGIARFRENGFTVSHASLKQSVLLESNYSHLSLIASLEQKFAKGDVGIISDCKNVEKFEVNYSDITQTQQKITLKQRLFHHFEKGAYVGRLEKSSYDVMNHQLFVEDSSGRKMTLIDQIEDLSVRFDENLNGGIVHGKGSEVYDWNHVVGVEINLIFNPPIQCNMYAALQH